ncbi:hypothetical protein BG015_007110 [Linnemannia schmuckeri]|uniref:C2H2-type domain-containing protein n=1 Tax=Linnemannia schmuckeri TaxID=64567 RepID=A0A9P5S178_9FUNG|nr:hypothetical protein BG015_007110 [Linnemannia schmuckeri]
MTHIIPTLKKDSTRNLCDQFTNIFYDDVNPTVSSSIDIALSLSISLAASASKSSSSVDVPSTSAAEYPSPASSSEESDDSLLVDSLSPPSSPWFPSLASSSSLLTDTVPKDHTKTSDDAAVGEDVDFFRNPFYRSLYNQDHQGSASVHPQSLFVQRTKRVSLPLAVKSAQHRSSSGQVSQTAAPSDLFNVDQILSAEPLNLSMETQQLLLSAVEAFPSSQEEKGDKQQQGGSSQEESDMMEDTLTSGSLSAPESDEDDEFEAMERVEHGQRESDCGNHSDADYCESTPTQQKKTRSAAVAKKTSRSGASTTGKAPRTRKGTYKRSLKVYPQRRPKANIKQEELDENDVEIKTEYSKNHGILLPGGFKLPLDKDGYLCEFCPKERFGRVHDLKRHQISKHNERTWPCDFCHRPFVRRDALLRHYAVKTARKDGVHPTAEDVDRLSEARARARLI